MNIKTKLQAIKYLAKNYDRNGYVRLFDPEKRNDAGSQKYKKGDEVRLSAKTDEELALIEHSLTITKFNYGRSYNQARQVRIPIYGREQVKRFLNEIDPYLSADEK